jgi:putative ATP-grasp target RiPP
MVPVSARFPLGRPRFDTAACDEAPSAPTMRPFGLRFASEAPQESESPLPSWRFCPVRQIAVTDDGADTAWHTLLDDGSMKTTGPSPDGTGNTGNEEWTPDFCPDEDLTA